MNGQFSLHMLEVGGPPMIHVTRSHRPEVVMFGKEHHFKLPLVADAGKHILVNGLSGAEITVSRFQANQPTQQRTVSTNVEDVIRAVVELGGTYPDVVQLLTAGKPGRGPGQPVPRERPPRVGPTTGPPQRGRIEEDDIDLPEETYELATPQPELFSKK